MSGWASTFALRRCAVTENRAQYSEITVVIPCYKEKEGVVVNLYNQLTWAGFQVIVVDDGSTMDLPDEVNCISYKPNMGYGYAIKRGIERANTPIVCTADGDGQHDHEDVKKLCDIYRMVTDCKMVIGRRWDLKESPLRWWGRKVLNFIASTISGHYMVDLNSGIRVFNTKLALGYAPILCDTFSFTTSLTMSMVTDKHKVEWISVDVKPRVFGKSHVRVVKDGLVTLYYIVWVGLALRTRNLRAWIRKAITRT